MFHNALVVAKEEFNRMRKSILFWIGLVVIVIASFVIGNLLKNLKTTFA